MYDKNLIPTTGGLGLSSKVRTIMTRAKFEQNLCFLNASIVEAIQEHFKAAKIDFNTVAFLEATAMDVDTVVRNAMFYGAEVFPIDIPVKG